MNHWGRLLGGAVFCTTVFALIPEAARAVDQPDPIRVNAGPLGNLEINGGRMDLPMP